MQITTIAASTDYNTTNYPRHPHSKQSHTAHPYGGHSWNHSRTAIHDHNPSKITTPARPPPPQLTTLRTTTSTVTKQRFQHTAFIANLHTPARAFTKHCHVIFLLHTALHRSIAAGNTFLKACKQVPHPCPSRTYLPARLTVTAHTACGHIAHSARRHNTPLPS